MSENPATPARDENEDTEREPVGPRYEDDEQAPDSERTEHAADEDEDPQSHADLDHD